MKKICVVGGGNLGHYLVAKLGQENDIYVYSRNADMWKSEIVALDIEGREFAGRIKVVSSDADETVGKAEIIFITWPTNVINVRITEIENCIKEGAWLCFCPGYGGKEFLAKKLLDKGVHILGTQRVFSSTKIMDYGKKVACIDNRPLIHVAAVKRQDTLVAKKMMEELFHKQCKIYDNYLNIALTPSNPVLHTSRLFSLFYDYQADTVYEKQFAFYSEWNDRSSEVLLNCDNEVQEICGALSDLNTVGVASLKDHYEIMGVAGCVSDIERMTTKIKSLKFLKDQAPMVKKGKGYVPDLKSRYFQEDFVFGLYLISNIGNIVGVETKQMNQIMQWYSALMGEDSLEQAKKALPQTYGIVSKQQLTQFYLQ